jgi:hypothetical protein
MAAQSFDLAERLQTRVDPRRRGVAIIILTCPGARRADSRCRIAIGSAAGRKIIWTCIVANLARPRSISRCSRPQMATDALNQRPANRRRGCWGVLRTFGAAVSTSWIFKIGLTRLLFGKAVPLCGHSQ